MNWYFAAGLVEYSAVLGFLCFVMGWIKGQDDAERRRNLPRGGREL
jgi:hypothetical protein